MNNFEISFSFEHRHYQAKVTVIRAEDHIQYTISPEDEHLLKEFGTQVIHEFPGKPFQLAFPGTTDERKTYSEALIKGLQHFLGEKPVK